MDILAALLELLWPTHCAGCDALGALLCEACLDSMIVIDPAGACRRCGAPFGKYVCTECMGEEWALDQNWSLGEFVLPLSRALVFYKDRGERRLGQILGELLAQGYERQAARRPAPDIVTWIPSTEEALRRRGFDHARVLATGFVSALGWAAPVPLLERDRARDQRGLSRAERAQNVSDTFTIDSSGYAVDGAEILVIDDVFTTGATMNEAARILVQSGAEKVRSATLARVW